MVWAIPFVELDGEFLVAIFIGALALLLFATYTIAHKVWFDMRGTVAGIAVVGGALAGAGDHVIGALRVLALGLNSATLWAISHTLGTLHTIGDFITRVVVKPVVDWANLINLYANNINALVTMKVLPMAQQALSLGQLAVLDLGRDIYPAVDALQTAEAATQRLAQGVYNDLTVVVHPDISKLQADLTRTQAQLAALSLALGPLVPVVQALATVGTWPLDLPARTGTLEGDLGALRDRLGLDEGKLAKVLPLSVITALGAEAVQVLERIAEDPCNIVPLCLLLNDIPDRVEALENFGA